MVGGAAGRDIRPALKSGWGKPSDLRQGTTLFRAGKHPTAVVVDSGSARVSICSSITCTDWTGEIIRAGTTATPGAAFLYDRARPTSTAVGHFSSGPRCTSQPNFSGGADGGLRGCRCRIPPSDKERLRRRPRVRAFRPRGRGALRASPQEQPGLGEHLQVVILRVLDPDLSVATLDAGVRVPEASEALANPGTRGGQSHRIAPGVEAERRVGAVPQPLVDLGRKQEEEEERGQGPSILAIPRRPTCGANRIHGRGLNRAV